MVVVGVTPIEGGGGRLVSVPPRHVRRSPQPLIGDEIEFALSLGTGGAKRFYCRVTDISSNPPNR